MGVKADLGTVLRELRKRSGHTQTSAANAATEYLEKLSETVALKEAERSITGSALSYQERKEKEEEQKKEPQTPNVFVLLALAHVYGVSLGDVFAELGVSSKEIWYWSISVLPDSPLLFQLSPTGAFAEAFTRLMA